MVWDLVGGPKESLLQWAEYDQGSVLTRKEGFLDQVKL